MGVAIVTNGEQLPMEEEPIIKPKRRAATSYMEKEIDLGGKYSLSNMLKSGIKGAPEAHPALLDEFKIQEDVTMYSQLHGYDDFRGFHLPNGADLSAISKRVYEEHAKPPWPTLNINLLSAFIPNKLFRAHMELCVRDKKKRKNLS